MRDDILLLLGTLTKGMNTVHIYTFKQCGYNTIWMAFKVVLAWNIEDEIDTITVYHATAKVECPKSKFNSTGNYGRGVGCQWVVRSLAWD